MAMAPSPRMGRGVARSAGVRMVAPPPRPGKVPGIKMPRRAATTHEGDTVPVKGIIPADAGWGPAPLRRSVTRHAPLPDWERGSEPGAPWADEPG